MIIHLLHTIVGSELSCIMYTSHMHFLNKIEQSIHLQKAILALFIDSFKLWIEEYRKSQTHAS